MIVADRFRDNETMTTINVVTALTAFGLMGCLSEGTMSRSEVKTAYLAGELSTEDPCLTYGFYGDGVCDRWCPSADEDCQAEGRTACESAGLRCAPGLVDGSNPPPNVCRGTTRVDVSCQVEGGPVAEEICCDDTPVQPPNACVAAGHRCAPGNYDPRNPPADACTGTAVELSCGPLDIHCCDDDYEPATTECEDAGNICASYGPAGPGFGCPENSAPSSEVCNPAAEEICCQPNAEACGTTVCGDGEDCQSCPSSDGGSNEMVCIPKGAVC